MQNPVSPNPRSKLEPKSRVIYLLVLVVLVQSIYPITDNGSLVGLFIYQASYMTLVMAGILVARDNLVYSWMLVGLGLIWLVAGVFYALNQEMIWAQLAAYGAIALFQSMVVVVLVKFVFAAKVVTRDVLYAASTIYLLLGAIFVPIYGTIETVTFALTGGAHAFSDGSVAVGEIFTWQNFVYYSYATLTTLGYGDILPITMWARSAASLEAIVGVLYITIIMARLVGLYASREIEEESHKDK